MFIETLALGIWALFIATIGFLLVVFIPLAAGVLVLDVVHFPTKAAALKCWAVGLAICVGTLLALAVVCWVIGAAVQLAV